MNFYSNLPPEWQGLTCPGNGRGHGCGAGLTDEVTWERINSQGVIRRICHYGHSMEAKIPVEIPERPLPQFGNYRCRNFKLPPKSCPECGDIFTPHANRQTHCRDGRCRHYRYQRTGYMGHLVSLGNTREEARELAFKRYPRLNDLQERKKFQDRDECIGKITEAVRQKEIGIKALAILTAEEDGR